LQPYRKNRVEDGQHQVEGQTGDKKLRGNRIAGPQRQQAEYRQPGKRLR